MITQQYLKECLHYDPDTGVFTWLNDRPLSHFKNEHGREIWNARFAGTVAGAIVLDRRTAYRRMGMLGKTYRAHRLAWLYTYGEFPKDQIDHIDGHGLNNRIANLRDVSNSENQKNTRLRSDNTSGCVGVHFHKQRRRWQAYISTESGRRGLGFFASFDDAVAVRKASEIELGYNESHGRKS